MLPIEEALPALHAALTTHTCAVLEAPPGAGKTTRVPISLLTASWRNGKRILMLEPRRVAARASAHFMARTCGDAIGVTVGYRVRGDSRISARTQIEVVTEGVLARLLVDDASLDAYGAVLFDEFHERSLHADIGLALTLESQLYLRPDLRILVMSATLDGDRVARLLGRGEQSVPVIRSHGRMFPVETRHRAPRADERMEATVARAIRESLAADAGDMLVFLPGMSEQRRVADTLSNDPLLAAQRATVHVLHGSMPMAEQDSALAAAPSGERKVVLATSIAETSLTIEGVRVVIDSGWSRLPRYDARAGLTRLETIRVSRASADQRRGRAGRVAPGVCYRLWDAAQEHALVPRTRPEILDADLSSLALTLAHAGVHDATPLQWMDAPPVGALAQARELLRQLGALNTDGRITEHGKCVASLPLVPRLAQLLLGAERQGLRRLGADLVALLEERDVLRAEYGPPPTDMRLRVEALRRSTSNDATSLHGARVDHDALRRVRELSKQLERDVGSMSRAERGAQRNVIPDDDVQYVGALLALAFPDRVAQRRPGTAARFLLRGGIGAAVTKGDGLYDAEWLAIAELDGAPPEYRVARAVPLSRADVLTTFDEHVVTNVVVEWHEATKSVRARKRSTLGALVLAENATHEFDASQVRECFEQVIQRQGIDALPWGESATRLRERLAFVHLHMVALGNETGWPDVSAASLMANLDEWLGPQLDGLRTWSDLAALDWHALLLGPLTYSMRSALDRLAPTHLDVPSGSRIRVDYSDPLAPTLAVKLQEVFGWRETPRLCDGRVPVTLQLLSPAQRPVQVTRDLAGFWRSSYSDVRKELRGRYPRHPWPEDPLTALATRRAKPRGT